jgi:DNA mismatch endonuclease, patch repair protein
VSRPRKNRRSKLTKSQQMARVRTKGTAAELALRKELWRRGWRYRLHLPLPGRPDLAFLHERVAVFVDGCFWHGCPRHYTAPSTNPTFWQRKLAKNQQRDRDVARALSLDGWRIIRLWEHEVTDNLDMAVNRVISALFEATLLDSAKPG